MSAPDLAALLASLRSPDPAQREAALDEIGTLNPPHALDMIRPLLDDPDREVRGAAALNLGEIAQPAAIPLLLRIARTDSEPDVRYHALQALAAYHDPQILTFLLERLQTRTALSRKVKIAIAEQMGCYPYDEAVEALLPLLFDETDRYVRTTAAGALLTLNRPRLAPVWQRLLRDADHPFLVRTALHALADLTDQAPQEQVRTLLHAPDADLRAAAAFAAGALDQESLVPDLLALIQQESTQTVREQAIAALASYRHPTIADCLVAALTTVPLSPQARERIAEQLHQYSGAAVREALVRLSEDEEEAVRATARHALQTRPPDTGPSSA